jgi:hypothetical protein
MEPISKNNIPTVQYEGTTTIILYLTKAQNTKKSFIVALTHKII